MISINDSFGQYMGELLNGKPHGRGIYANESKILEGYWQKGQLDFRGREINSNNKTVWNGEMSYNIPVGSGKSDCPPFDTFVLTTKCSIIRCVDELRLKTDFYWRVLGPTRQDNRCVEWEDYIP